MKGGVLYGRAIIAGAEHGSAVLSGPESETGLTSDRPMAIGSAVPRNSPKALVRLVVFYRAYSTLGFQPTGGHRAKRSCQADAVRAPKLSGVGIAQWSRTYWSGLSYSRNRIMQR